MPSYRYMLFVSGPAHTQLRMWWSTHRRPGGPGMKHHQDNGGNISATCREFGISRATFYKWLKRYDPGKPSKPLRSRSRRPHATQKPTKWNRWDLVILAELDMKTGARLGAGRLSQQLKEYDIDMSRATIRRMLAKVRWRCPTCSRGGYHESSSHALHRDPGTLE